MSRIRMLSAGAIVISVIATTLAFAGEDRPRPERGPGRMGPRERLFDQMPQDVRDAFEKQRRGEQLTPEEAAKLDEFRGGMRDRIQRAFGRLTEAPGPAKPTAARTGDGPCRDGAAGRRTRLLLRPGRSGEPLRPAAARGPGHPGHPPPGRAGSGRSQGRGTEVGSRRKEGPGTARGQEPQGS